MRNSILNKKFNNDRYLGVSSIIIVINFLIYFVYIVFTKSRFASLTNYLSLLDLLSFNSANFLAGRNIWTLFTYPFLSIDFLTLLFSSLFIYFFGNRFEREIGSKEFIFVYFSSSVFCALLVVLISYIFGESAILLGASAPIFALIFILSCLHKYERVLLFFIFNIRLPLLVFILLFIDVLYLYLGLGDKYMTMLSLLGFLYALLYTKFRMKLNLRIFFKNVF